MTASIWTIISSVVIGVISAISAFYAQKNNAVVTDIKKNGITHIVAQVTPSVNVVPSKTICIDGVNYIEVPSVKT